MTTRVFENIHVRRPAGMPGNVPAGYVVKYHNHPFSHVTVIPPGTRLLVECKRSLDDDQPFRAETIDGPAEICIYKDIYHQFTFRTDGFYWCVYALRNKDHTVVENIEEWDGWDGGWQ